MSEVIGRKENKNFAHKILEIARPGYISNAYLEAGPLQYIDGNPASLYQKYRFVTRKMSNKVLLLVLLPIFTTILTLCIIYPDKNPLTMLFIVLPVVPSIVSGKMKDRIHARIKNMYKKDIETWLTTKNEMTVDEKELEKVMNTMLSADTTLVVTDTANGQEHTFTLNTNNIWTTA